MAAVSGRGFVQTYAVDLHGAGVEVTQNASVLGKDWVQTCAYYDPLVTEVSLVSVWAPNLSRRSSSATRCR